ELVGRPPAFVNSHQHVALFPPVGDVLVELFTDSARPLYARSLREPWHLLRHVAGAGLKRIVLSLLGRRSARRFERAGFLSTAWLAGLSNPGDANSPDY